MQGGTFSSAWYFSELSRYSLSKFDLAVNQHDERQVLLVRVLCGRIREFDLETRRAMDLRPKEHAVLAYGFHSARGGPHRALRFGPGPPDDSHVVAVYKEAQYYPEFLITFRHTGDVPHVGVF